MVAGTVAAEMAVAATEPTPDQSFNPTPSARLDSGVRPQIALAGQSIIGNGMKSTWLHSMLIVLVGTLALVLVHVFTVYAVDPTIYTATDLDPWPKLFEEPIRMLERLVPGLALGWFTRRHPLVVGAITGALASYTIPFVLGYRLFPMAQAGDAIANAMVVAVAFLAGRALRYRFQPSTAA